MANVKKSRTPKSDAFKKAEPGRSERSNARIVSTAMSIVARQGTHSLSMRKLGEAAGYSRGLANTKFGTKKLMFADLLRRSSDDRIALITSQVGEKTGLAAIDAFFKLFRPAGPKNNELLKGRLILTYETIGGNGAARKVIARHHTLTRAILVRWIREAVRDDGADPVLPPSQLATVLNASMTGLLYDWLSNPKRISLARDFANLRRGWYRMLGCARSA